MLPSGLFRTMNDHFPFLIQNKRGSVLIAVLWTIALVAVLAALLASEVRLNSQVVFRQKQMLSTWADTLSTLRMAEMELMLQRMPPAPGAPQTGPEQEKNKKPAYLLDGRECTLSYPAPENMAVRIYDHAGKINLRRIKKSQMRRLLEKLLGTDVQEIRSLLDAWQDWLDRDDLKRLNGAEKDYYASLDPPYRPRNGSLETVEELLLIKGFARAFEGVNLHAAFTVYGTHTKVNPNLATAETLRLLPGLDEEAINIILARRETEDYKSTADFAPFLDPEQLRQVAGWVNFQTSNYYTIAVYPKSQDGESGAETRQEGQPERREIWGYTETVQVRGYGKLPKVLQVRPVALLPSIPVQAQSGQISRFR